MFDDEALRSKYARLGLEYKKLRERHRSVKESLKEAIDRVTQLEIKLSDQTIHARNLEHEKESLIFRNQYLIKQTDLLEKQLKCANQKRGLPTPNGCSFEVCPQEDALKNALEEINRLHEEVVIFLISWYYPFNSIYCLGSGTIV